MFIFGEAKFTLEKRTEKFTATKIIYSVRCIKKFPLNTYAVVLGRRFETVERICNARKITQVDITVTGWHWEIFLVQLTNSLVSIIIIVVSEREERRMIVDESSK